MFDLILVFLHSLLVGFRSQAALQTEMIALRHQLTVTNLPCPIPPESLTVPIDDRFRFDDQKSRGMRGICDTGAGKLLGQEGIASLERAFLLAGAKAVIASLWPADDIFTIALMKRMYQHGADKGASLLSPRLPDPRNSENDGGRPNAQNTTVLDSARC